MDEGGGWCCGDELGSLWDGSMASRQYALWYIVIAIVKVDVYRNVCVVHVLTLECDSMHYARDYCRHKC